MQGSPLDLTIRLSTLAFYYLKLAPWSGVYLFGLLLVLIWCGIQMLARGG